MLLVLLVGLGAGACAAPPDAGRTAPIVVSTASASSSASTVAPSPRASATSAAAHLSRSAPVRLQIPAIGVDSSLMALGLNSDGTMQVPPSGFPAGWYTGAPTPGEIGPAIIAGHVDWNGPAVF
ncbi:MAG TPA: class F sortase, partial [Cellulomonadaceae bacterium]|nr:class F sortase [Cellulomonadaceae bacterium]